MYHSTKKIALLIVPVLVAGCMANTFSGTHPKKNVYDNDILPGQTVHWNADTTYILNGIVCVDSGAILRIDSGTVILAHQEEDAVKPTCLVVCRFGKILAEGSQNKPIIFSTDLEDPTVYSIADDQNYWDKNMLWGGIIILGNAPINNNEGKTDDYIEGLNPNEERRGIFGGPDENDNSGKFRYVSIRHGGFPLPMDNNVNGLTMGGVGRATTIEYVEVYNNSEDGFEWFGGTVNARYLVSAFNADDAFDYDDAWRGRGQFWFGIQSGSGFLDGDEGIECDGGANVNQIQSNPVISNVTLIGNGTNGIMDLKEYAEGRFFKVIANNFRRGFRIDTTGNTISAYDNMINGRLFIKQSLYYNTGDVTLRNQWLGSVEPLVPDTVIRDLMLSWGNTIKDPLFASWDNTMYYHPITKDAPRTPEDPPFDSLGFDFRPTGNSPAILSLNNPAFNMTADSLQKLINAAAIEDSSGCIEPTAYSGAFSPWERPWYEGWTAVWNYGMAKHAIENATTSLTKPAMVTTFKHVSHFKTFNDIKVVNNAISLQISTRKNVLIELYNVAGKKVSTVYSGVTGPGIQSFAVSGQMLSNGYYICRIRVGETVVSKRVIVFSQAYNCK